MAPEGQIVYLVDDDQAVRESIALLLRSVGLEVLDFADADAFLCALEPEMSGCVLLDIRMPRMSGLDLQEKLSRLSSPLPIIFLTGHADVALAVRAMQAGAFHFLEKPCNDQELLDQINRALALDRNNRSELSETRLIRERRSKLTAREREVMELVVEGMPNKAIAHDLDISERTVEVHRARIMEKMQAGSLAHLVRMRMSIHD